jgi:hypothetical protein
MTDELLSDIDDDGATGRVGTEGVIDKRERSRD